MRLAIVCLAACGSTAPRAMQPSDVGLPDTPAEDPHAAPRYVPRASEPPAFYRHETCPPGRYGCVLSRTTTVDRVRTTLACPGNYASYTGTIPLRVVRHGALDVDGDLERATVRHGLARVEQRIDACLQQRPEPLRVTLRGAISPDGHTVIEAETETALRTCFTDALREASFPRSLGLTTFAWPLDYTVEDPSARPPLACP